MFNKSKYKASLCNDHLSGWSKATLIYLFKPKIDQMSLSEEEKNEKPKLCAVTVYRKFLKFCKRKHGHLFTVSCWLNSEMLVFYYAISQFHY